MMRASKVHERQEGGDLVRGACLFACVLLQQSLEQFAECTVAIRGGDGESDGGLVDAQGVKQGHYWIEGSTATGDRFLADITADQFHFELVVLLWQEDAAWERYQAGGQDVVNAHVTEMWGELESAGRMP